MIETSQATRSGWCVVTVLGRADAEAADQMETDLQNITRQHPKVAVDLSGLNYISSAGVRALLQAARTAKDGATEFAVCSPSPSVKRVLDMCKVGLVIRIDQTLPV